MARHIKYGQQICIQITSKPPFHGKDARVALISKTSYQCFQALTNGVYNDQPTAGCFKHSLPILIVPIFEHLLAFYVMKSKLLPMYIADHGCRCPGVTHSPCHERTTPPSSCDLACQHSSSMNRERRGEPRTAELPDGVQDARVVGSLSDDATQV